MHARVPTLANLLDEFTHHHHHHHRRRRRRRQPLFVFRRVIDPLSVSFRFRGIVRVNRLYVRRDVCRLSRTRRAQRQSRDTMRTNVIS